MRAFHREDRYLILKREDIRDYLTPHGTKSLHEICETIDEGRKSQGKSIHRFVVVKDTWPMYEAVWKMIETLFNSNKDKS